MSGEAFAEGGCNCGAVRYRLHDAPYVVHCCHCRWCQRETGSAFVLNALIESDRIELLSGAPERRDLPTYSGGAQTVIHCPSCDVALWSHFSGGNGEKASFLRVATLDEPAACPPDVHIYTASRQPWVAIPESVEQFAGFYSGKDIVRIYGEAGAARSKALRG